MPLKCQSLLLRLLPSFSFMVYRKLADGVAASPACGTKGSVRLLFVSFHFFTLDKLKIFVTVALSPEAVASTCPAVLIT